MQLLLALSLLAATPSSDDLLLKVGDPAPPFSMRDLDRQMFSLANHAGARADDPRKAILVVFFATWCEPCKKEVPIIKKIHEQLDDSGQLTDPALAERLEIRSVLIPRDAGVLSALGMGLAIVVSIISPMQNDQGNYLLILLAILVGY